MFVPAGFVEQRSHHNLTADTLMTMNQTTRWIGLAVIVLICFAAAGIGSLATTPQIPGWYADLVKPAWNPPNWIFGPVWSCLYLMMAVAAWLVWRQAGFASAKLPLALFAIHLPSTACGPCCSSDSRILGLRSLRSSCSGRPSWRRWSPSGNDRDGPAACWCPIWRGWIESV